MANFQILNHLISTLPANGYTHYLSLNSIAIELDAFLSLSFSCMKVNEISD